MPNWLGQGRPRYLVKHYPWVCQWEYFGKRLAWISRLSKVGCYPTPGWAFQSVEQLNRAQRWRKGKSILCLALSAGTSAFSCTRTGTWLAGFGWNHTGFPEIPTVRWLTVGIFNPIVTLNTKMHKKVERVDYFRPGHSPLGEGKET